MAQKEIEMILARRLAEYLAVPIFIVDEQGMLAFYNESAERILGSRFAETGELRLEDWATGFKPTDDDGRPLAPDELPLAIALTRRQPSNRRLWIEGLDGVRRRVEVTAFPLVGQADRRLGAVALFWEPPAA